MDKKIITGRVEQLRRFMKQHRLDAFIVPSSDSHMSEYTPPRWQSRQWLTGFGGSAGTAVVTASDAALWTDSRYFIEAAAVLQGTPFKLMKDGVSGTPTIAQWLCVEGGEFKRVGVDGSVVTPAMRNALANALAAKGITVVTDFDPFSEIWQDRPDMPTSPITIQPMEYAGESCRSKIVRLLAEADALGCNAILLSALDDIAWTLNLRGDDVECNPVFVGYLLISGSGSTLFTTPSKASAAVRDYLHAEGVSVEPFSAMPDAIKTLDAKRTLLTTDVNCAVESLFEPKRRVIAPSPAQAMKAVKNDAEIAGFHAAMLRDGVAMVNFLSRLHSEVEKGITEIGVDTMLTSQRAAQELYRGLSFPTIAAYGPHAAIVHYEATPETDVTLEPHGMILIDSGAQYQDGTTDITRTIALGPLSHEEQLIYTLVLKGHIALEQCVFPDGASGTQIDCMARSAMWKHFYNYGHGTGHGVGSYLNVHEGPHQIRMNYMPAPLHAGMTVTDEPGIYCEGRCGVRTENTLLIVPAGESEFGKFLKFEPLTLCPIDTAPIILDMLTDDELHWLNSYHAMVRSRLMPLVEDHAVQHWLGAATEPIMRR